MILRPYLYLTHLISRSFNSGYAMFVLDTSHVSFHMMEYDTANNILK